MALEQMQERLRGAAEEALPDREIKLRAMFGGYGAYVEGRVFALLSHAGLGLKLSPSDSATLLDLPGAYRPRYAPDLPESKHYVAPPPEVCADTEALSGWVGKSMTFVVAQPAPKTRAKKTRKED